MHDPAEMPRPQSGPQGDAVSAPTEAPAVSEYLGIFVVAGASLIVEVGFTRIFSFTYWYHFAYLIISVAMLGIGASGSFLTAFPRLAAPKRTRKLALYSLLAAFGCLASIGAVAAVRVVPSMLLREPGQWVRVCALYAVFVLPFFFTGLVIAVLLSRYPQRTPRLYCFDLAGAGLGCILVVQLFWGVGAVKAILSAAVLYTFAAAVFLNARAWRVFPSAVLAAGALGAVAWMWQADGAALRIPPAPEKAMSDLLRDEGAPRLEFTRWTPICRVDAIGWGDDSRSRRVGLWSNWGMSPRFTGSFPLSKFFAQDGDACTTMYHYRGDPHEMEFLRHSILSTPYQFLHRPNVLIIGLGGGTDVHVALLHQAQHVTGVDINPVIVGLMTERYRDWNGDLYARPDVSVHVAEGRSFARRAATPFDFIQLNGVDTLAALSSGAYILSESYLYTVDAMHDLLRHLSPNGVLSLVIAEEDLQLGGTTPDDLRVPRFTTRLLSILGAALRRDGVAQPERHWLVVTNQRSIFQIKMVNVITKRSPFAVEEIDRYRGFVDSMDFQSWYFPGQDVAGAPLGRFVTFDDAARQRFFERSPLDLRPTTDDQPFFFNFYKWRSLFTQPELQRDRPSDRPGRAYGEGQIVLLLMLVQAVVVSVLLIGWPLRRLQRVAHEDRRAAAGTIVYFAALGLGFILIEIGFVQKFTLFLGYPTYSLSCVLAAMLIFSGLGSMRAQQVEDSALLASILRGLGMLAVLVVLLVAVYPSVFTAFLPLALAARVALAIGLIAPFGLVMGRFFPLGIRVVHRLAPASIPWAWAINGCCSVVGTILAVILAISLGFQRLFVLAFVVYVLGVLALYLSARQGESATPSRGV
jgi:hypothetical protein